MASSGELSAETAGSDLHLYGIRTAFRAILSVCQNPVSVLQVPRNSQPFYITWMRINIAMGIVPEIFRRGEEYTLAPLRRYCPS